MVWNWQGSHLLSLFIACLALWMAPGTARAQAGLIGKPLKVCVLRDAGKDTPAALFRHPERFDCITPQHRLGAGSYWALSSPIAASSSSRQAKRRRKSSPRLAALDIKM